MDRGATVLVVEDEEFIRALLREILEAQGLRVLLASEGGEALDLFSRCGKEIDLVILDLVLPGMKGEEILTRMKELDPEVKVLITTGFGEEEPVERVRKLGIEGVLTKPFRLPMLLKTIGAVLGGEGSLSH